MPVNTKDLNAITITQEQPDTPEAITLIQALDDYLEPLYPIENRHGLSVKRLLEEKVAFFILRYQGKAVGCGGVQFFGREYAELKRMYVRSDYQRLGLGTKLLEHLETYVQSLGINVLRLETGIYQRDAIRLYERMGYYKIGPFGDYKASPLNLFLEKTILPVSV